MNQILQSFKFSFSNDFVNQFIISTIYASDNLREEYNSARMAYLKAVLNNNQDKEIDLAKSSKELETYANSAIEPQLRAFTDQQLQNNMKAEIDSIKLQSQQAKDKKEKDKNVAINDAEAKSKQQSIETKTLR